MGGGGSCGMGGVGGSTPPLLSVIVAMLFVPLSGRLSLLSWWRFSVALVTSPSLTGSLFICCSSLKSRLFSFSFFFPSFRFPSPTVVVVVDVNFLPSTFPDFPNDDKLFSGNFLWPELPWIILTKIIPRNVHPKLQRLPCSYFLRSEEISLRSLCTASPLEISRLPAIHPT